MIVMLEAVQGGQILVNAAQVRFVFVNAARPDACRVMFGPNDGVDVVGELVTIRDQLNAALS